MAIQLKEKWDHLATAGFEYSDDEEDEEYGRGDDGKHEKYMQLQQRID